jgi:hypothetical protein
MASAAAIPTPSSLSRGNPFSAPGPPSPTTATALAQAASSASADVLVAEAFVLYLKALAFLQRGIEKARLFWEGKDPASRQGTSVDFNDGELSVGRKEYEADDARSGPVAEDALQRVFREGRLCQVAVSRRDARVGRLCREARLRSRSRDGA